MSAGDDSQRPAFADPDLDLKTRMALAAGLSRRDRIWAVLAQTDCQACGTDCRGLAEELDSAPDSDPARCAPGGAETTRAIRAIFEEGPEADDKAIVAALRAAPGAFGPVSDAQGRVLGATESKDWDQDRLIFLGSGTSYGVPRIACDCPVCLSEDPRDRRMRSSALVWSVRGKVLIDCGPDVRQQLLRHRIDHLDAVVITHAHSDHMMGLDDLRPLTHLRSSPLPIYADERTAEVLRRTFDYIFASEGFRPGIPWMTLRTIEEGSAFQAGEFAIRPFRVEHGRIDNLGLRIGDFAYLTDVKRVPPESCEILAGVRMLVLDMLREEEHATHLCWAESLELVERLGRPRTWLVHMGHEISHRGHSKRLPSGVGLAWDGLELKMGQLLSP